MAELLIVVALLVTAVVVVAIPWASLLAVGAVTTVTGLVAGLVTGLWYHVALARAVRATRALPAWWWLRPVSLHVGLDPNGRRRVMPWFYAGAAAFVVTVLGLAAVVVALAMARPFAR